MIANSFSDPNDVEDITKIFILKNDERDVKSWT